MKTKVKEVTMNFNLIKLFQDSIKQDKVTIWSSFLYITTSQNVQ